MLSNRTNNTSCLLNHCARILVDCACFVSSNAALRCCCHIRAGRVVVEISHPRRAPCRSICTQLNGVCCQNICCIWSNLKRLDPSLPGSGHEHDLWLPLHTTSRDLCLEVFDAALCAHSQSEFIIVMEQLRPRFSSNCVDTVTEPAQGNDRQVVVPCAAVSLVMVGTQPSAAHPNRIDTARMCLVPAAQPCS